MSTDYYFLCAKCSKAIHVAQDGLGGFTFYSGEPNCMKALATFLDPVDGHGSHGFSFEPEQHIDEEEIVEWART